MIPRKVHYVALADDKVIGCLMTTTEWSKWRNGAVLWIQSQYVLESHRKYGTFKAMFKNLKAMGMDGSHYTMYEWMKIS